MARWQTLAALLAVVTGNIHASKHKKARALLFTFRHRGAHAHVIGKLVAAQQEHEARRDEQFFRRALKRAAAKPDHVRHTDPLPWTRRGKQLARKRARA